MNEARRLLNYEVVRRSLRGESNRAIARAMGLAPRTVKKILAREELRRTEGESALDRELPARRPPRASKLDVFEERIAAWLERYPDLTATLSRNELFDENEAVFGQEQRCTADFAGNSHHEITFTSNNVDLEALCPRPDRSARRCTPPSISPSLRLARGPHRADSGTVIELHAHVRVLAGSAAVGRRDDTGTPCVGRAQHPVEPGGVTSPRRDQGCEPTAPGGSIGEEGSGRRKWYSTRPSGRAVRRSAEIKGLSK